MKTSAKHYRSRTCRQPASEFLRMKVWPIKTNADRHQQFIAFRDLISLTPISSDRRTLACEFEVTDKAI